MTYKHRPVLEGNSHILNEWVNALNSHNDHYNLPLYSYPEDRADCRPMFVHIAMELSPSNLTHEISELEANNKKDHLLKVWKALEFVYRRSVSINMALSFSSLRASYSA